MIPLGTFSTLEAKRQLPQGIYLEDDHGDEVLLPNKYIPKQLQIGDQLSVFVYTDSEDRLIATTLTPYIQLHQFACLQCVHTTEFGAFLDWGLEKDLFVPFKEQQKKMQTGKWYLVYLYTDTETDRLVATARINRHLDNENLTVSEGDQVDLLVGEPSDLGYQVIINHLHSGLVYHNEIFQPIELGDRIKGYVKQIRPDHKLDIALRKQGYEHIQGTAGKILRYLQNNKGFSPLHDKSSPDEIMAAFQMSKKSFKKSIGMLYKQKLIRISDKGIFLVKEQVKK